MPGNDDADLHLIGNDLVDLQDPETRPDAIHPRFDQRVFSAGEQLALAASAVPNRLRWSLWAAKEAAYKAWRRLEPTLTFLPARFHSRLDGEGCGVVTHEGRVVPVRIDLEGDLIHAVAGDWNVGGLVAAVAQIPRQIGAQVPGPRQLVRQLAVARLSHRLGVAREALHIEREGRIPRLWIGDNPANVDLSLSHHGRFVAFACRLG